MKKADKDFRRKLKLAHQGEGKDIKRYPLSHNEDEGITIYSSGNIVVSCSSNLLSPEGTMVLL